MNFMAEFNQVADKTLMPIANKIVNQPLSALRDGMAASIPLHALPQFKGWFSQQARK